VARDPLGGGLTIKRVRHVRRSAVWLLGDNPQRSADSRVWGWVDDDAIVARIVLALRPRQRTRR